MTITYLCPAVARPVGGIKVLYRHSQMLREHGIASDVLHPTDTAFRCEWFSHRAAMRREPDFDRSTDLVVIPEIWAARFAQPCLDAGLRYAIFVQNPYRIVGETVAATEEVLQQAYCGAQWLLGISDDACEVLRLKFPGFDAARILRLKPGISDLFRPGAKRKLISYMPRKLPAHAMNLAFLLAADLRDGWSLCPIDGRSEAEVAATLAESAIFLSLSELEGLALPPMEATLSGNVVVGYTGQGAKEFFSRPLLREVAHGDLVSFAAEVRHAMRDVEAGLLDSTEATWQRQALRTAYGDEGVLAPLLDFGRRVEASLRGETAQVAHTAKVARASSHPAAGAAGETTAR